MIQWRRGATLNYALRLADVGEGLQYRCVDGVTDWWRGHAAGCSGAGLSPAAIWLHRLLGALCELLGYASRVEFATLSL